MIFEMRNFRCGLGTVDLVSDPQGLLILYLVIFHSVEPDACPYFANEGIILNGIYNLNAKKKTTEFCESVLRRHEMCSDHGGQQFQEFL